MKQHIFFLAAAFIAAVLPCSCSYLEQPTDTGTTPSVQTNVITSFSSTYAYCTGSVVNGGQSVTARGFVCDTQEMPTVERSRKIQEGRGNNSFSSIITDLVSDTKYYVRAYATNSNGTSYGEQQSFTTLKKPKEHKFADLGLSVKWATEDLEDIYYYAHFFAWGEIRPYSRYDRQYEYCSMTTGAGNYLSSYYNYGYSWTSYSRSGSDCFVEWGNKPYSELSRNLNPENDAANVLWDDNWCIPTIEQFKELCDTNKCKWTYKAATYSGENNMFIVKSNNSKYTDSIIFYARGYFDATTPRSDNTTFQSYWWSSSLSDESDVVAECVSISRIQTYPLDSIGFTFERKNRCLGFAIRPVCK